MRTCIFAGHACVYAASIRQDMEAAVEAFLSETESALFYVGGRGEFDSMAASAVKAAKVRHKNKKIQLYLVEPYMRAGLEQDKERNEMLYDGIIIPQELLGVYPKAAITKRNRWMVEQADVLIAFVQRDFGGAYETVKYARKKKLTVVNLADKK